MDRFSWLLSLVSINSTYTSLGWLLEFYTTLCIWYWRKFECKLKTHRIQIKIINLEMKELLFKSNMKLCNMIYEKIKIWEGVSQPLKSHTKRLLKNLSERILFKNLLKYLYTAKIRFSEFGCLRAKMVKNSFIFTYLRWKRNRCTFTLTILLFYLPLYHITMVAESCHNKNLLSSKIIFKCWEKIEKKIYYIWK